MQVNVCVCVSKVRARAMSVMKDKKPDLGQVSTGNSLH